MTGAGAGVLSTNGSANTTILAGSTIATCRLVTALDALPPTLASAAVITAGCSALVDMVQVPPGTPRLHAGERLCGAARQAICWIDLGRSGEGSLIMHLRG